MERRLLTWQKINQNQGQQTQQAAGTAQAQTPTAQQNQSNQQGAAPAIDYGKIQQMLDGTLAAKEDTALKAYFKQQGLSQQEVEQAIAAFKQQKAANTPDVGAMQTQLTQAQEAAKQAQIQNAAILAAVSLGIDAKTIPYILKMADLSQAVGQDGKVNEENLKAALNKVLEDVPGLKPQAAGTTGFVQVGAASGNAGAGQAQQATQTQQTGVPAKRWNRWNN
jgi:hypothetical protein